MFRDQAIVKRSLGFSLIEIMLGSALSILLLGVLLNIYLTLQHSFRIQKSLNTIQENAELASSILNTEIHKAGYIGCPRLTEDFPIIKYPPFTITAKNKLIGSSYEIIVRYADYPNVELIQPMHKLDTLYTTNNVHFSPGDILIISNCTQVEIFKLKKVTPFQGGQQLIAAFPLHVAFSSHAEISRLVINKYFIDQSNFQNQNEKPSKSLFVENIFHHRFELINGINKMQLLYSIIQDGKIIDLPAHEITNWDKVVGVAIHLDIISNQFKKNWNLYVALENR